MFLSESNDIAEVKSHIKKNENRYFQLFNGEKSSKNFS